MVTSASPPASPGMAAHAALRGMREAGSRAAEAAFAIARGGAARPLEPGRAELRALAAGPDPLKGLAELQQARLAYRANAAVLRGAEAARAALLRDV